MSSLGFQLVYSLLNEQDDLVCERFFLPEKNSVTPPLSIESSRTGDQFPFLLFSVSFEHDYVNIVKMLDLLQAGIYSRDRSFRVSASCPLVIIGGVATFMNPEPLADFADLFFIGEVESGFRNVITFLSSNFHDYGRKELLEQCVKRFPGCYVPSFYTPVYGEGDRLEALIPEEGFPERIRKKTLSHSDVAGHSKIITSDTEFADLFLAEMGRGCSRGCRFCTAGFIFRPPRLWDGDAVVRGLKERFEGIQRVGLLGMEMADMATMADIFRYLQLSGCALSFSSLRADRIESDLLDILKNSKLKSVAIAPDGASERLRKAINKGLREGDILKAAEKLVEIGIYKLKIYLMVGLPSEEMNDIKEAIALVGKIKNIIDPIGKKRGRLTEIILSVNCFVPKPWTPFQFHPFGGGKRGEPGSYGDLKDAMYTLTRKLTFLKKGLKVYKNVVVHNDKPEKVLLQAVLAMGDRRVAALLVLMALGRMNLKQAMKRLGMKPDFYVQYNWRSDEFMPWDIIDHGIRKNYLYNEYLKTFIPRETSPCDVTKCRRCGVCHD